MKNQVLIGWSILVLLGYFSLTLPSCQEDEIAPLGLKMDVEENNLAASSILGNHSLIVAPNSIPFGKTFQQWTIEWWKYVMSFECNINPLLNDIGQTALDGQNGPVVFVTGTTVGTATRELTIGKDKLVLFPVISVINDYPCPDAKFKPEAGQTVESYLMDGARITIDNAQNLIVTLDGMPIRIAKANRYPTKLFYFTGNSDLVNCLDPCVTGLSQAAVSDGYWIMLNKLRAGQHVLRFHGEIPALGYTTDVTYLLTVK